MHYGAWLGWQIDYLLWFQNFRDITHHIFDNFFLTITTFGEIIIPIIFICTLYWTINKKIGQFVLWSYIFGFIANILAKTTACIYRPWILDTRIHPLAQAIPAATGYSFPSGHTAGAVTTWGGTAFAFWNNKLVRYTGLAIIIGVMISRNYVGVHTPQDVVVSFFLSCIVLWIANKAISYSEKDSKNDKYIILAVLTIIIAMLTYVIFKSYPIHYLFGKILYDPTPMKYEAIVRSGFIIGAFSGWFIEKRFINFSPETGTFSQKVARLLVGLTFLTCLYSISSIFKNMMCENLTLGLSGMCVQHIILGLFITCIYPFFIKKYNRL